MRLPGGSIIGIANPIRLICMLYYDEVAPRQMVSYLDFWTGTIIDSSKKKNTGVNVSSDVELLLESEVKIGWLKLDVVVCGSLGSRSDGNSVGGEST